MSTRMTTAAWERGFKNALMCAMGVFAVLGASTLAVAVVFQQSLRDAGIIAFGTFWTLIFAIFILSWLFGKYTSGPILLDCGPHPMRSLFLVNAVLFALLGVGGGFALTFGVAGILFGLTFFLFNLVLASGRLQLREDGIWQYWSLLRWRKIKSYGWKGESNPTLILQVKTKFPSLGRGALPVPIEHKDTVDILLQEHCGSKQIESLC